MINEDNIELIEKIIGLMKTNPTEVLLSLTMSGGYFVIKILNKTNKQNRKEIERLLVELKENDKKYEDLSSRINGLFLSEIENKVK